MFRLKPYQNYCYFIGFHNTKEKIMKIFLKTANSFSPPVLLRKYRSFSSFSMLKNLSNHPDFIALTGIRKNMFPLVSP